MKSPEEVPVTVTVMLVLCEIEPLDPVRATTYVPRGVEDEADAVNVEVPVPPLDRVTLVMLKASVRPAGEEESDSITVPVNPLRLVRVVVEDTEEP